MAHGLDHVFTGCRQICTGEYETPTTVQLLKHAECRMKQQLLWMVQLVLLDGVSGLFANSGKALFTLNRTPKLNLEPKKICDFIWTEVKVNGKIERDGLVLVKLLKNF